MTENFKIIVDEAKGFTKVECVDGHYITNWNKEDIMEYTDAKVMYCPLGYDLEKFYCVTEEEHNTYLAEQEAKMLEMKNNEENKQ